MEPHTNRTPPPPFSLTVAAAGGTNDQANQSQADVGAGRLSESHRPDPTTSMSTDHLPPPPYSASYGNLEFDQDGFGTSAKVSDDGRVNIAINQGRSRRLSNLLVPALRSQLSMVTPEELAGQGDASSFPPPPAHLAAKQPTLGPPPKLNIVIQVIGSRGDIQPFLALALALVTSPPYHRVRVATHPTFRSFVTSVHPALEFFSIGGDPAELMAFMVKNPGLMPGMDSLRSGDVGKRRKGMYEIMKGCWRSCIDATDGTGEAYGGLNTPTDQPRSFIADAIIANPPSFAHLHCAEKLGIPCHLMFTMPWSPTQSFSHPLANITATDVPTPLTNFMSYALVEMMTWQGLGDLVNRFRESHLQLEPLSTMWAPAMIPRLKVPYTYCWSPALIPKPRDWGAHITISGFYFLDLASTYSPPADLMAFLQPEQADARPIVYIGFGSIVVDDPDGLTSMIFEAVASSGVRALVSKGWGGLGGSALEENKDIFLLGNVPHDWLFKYITAVVHHGGAGTTAAGIRAGKPTVVVPFFGDQPFWGAMVHRAGAGPAPIPFKKLDADNLAEAIGVAIGNNAIERAKELGERIKTEEGAEIGKKSFEEMLDLVCDANYDTEEVPRFTVGSSRGDGKPHECIFHSKHEVAKVKPTTFGSKMRCMVLPERTAVWRMKRTEVRLSALAATILGNAGLIEMNDLKLVRHKEWDTESGPYEPISGATSALLGTVGSIMMGIGDMPREVFKGIKKSSQESAAHAEDGKLGKSASSKSGTGGRSTPNLDTTLSSASEKDLQHEASESRDSLQSSLATVTTSGEELAATDTMSTISTLDDTSASGSRTPTSSAMSPIDSDTASISTAGKAKGHHGKKLHKDRSTAESASESFARGENVTLAAITGTGKGVGRIVQAGLKSPMDFTVALAQGFHNAPKLYGDKVRKQEKVTGISSGLKAAGKGFGLGMYDGITGFFTQPIKGAQQDGAAGFVKGFGRGIGGIVLKPGAAFWGIPGYTFKGVYEEFRKHAGGDEQAYIVAMRVQQGYEDLAEAREAEKELVVTRWHMMELDKATKGSRKSRDRYKLSSSPSRSPVGTPPRSESPTFGAKEWKAARANKDKKKSGKAMAFIRHNVEAALSEHRQNKSGVGPTSSLSQSVSSAEDEEFERAIRASVQQTSQGDPEQDRMIERALRASIAELRRPSIAKPGALETQDEEEEEAVRRAIEASIAEAKKEGMAEDETALQEAINASMEGHATAGVFIGQKPPLPDRNQIAHKDGDHDDASEDEWPDTEDDEEFKKVVAESMRHQKGVGPGKSAWQDDEDIAPDAMPSHAGLPGSSTEQAWPQAAPTTGDGSSDPDLAAALAASKLHDEEQQRQADKMEAEQLEAAKRASLAEHKGSDAGGMFVLDD